RRDFLKLSIASSLLAACDMWQVKGKIGLALGGGGAKGLAHIQMLQVLDELNLRPHRIAGTSIGAIMGALYASGMSGQEIQQLIDRLTVSKDESWWSALFEEDVGRWWDIIEIQLGRGGLVDTQGLAGFLREIIPLTQFEDLNIPLKVVAADFWERKQVVFDRGDLFPALQASIAIPGLFSPVQYKGRVLVDGGLVNPVPYDLLFDECEVVIGIDVLGNRTPVSGDDPSYFENTFNTFQIMQASIVREKIKCQPPHIYIHPDLNNIRVLDFHRFEEIYAQARPAQKKLKRALRYYQL
ncbi:MAG: patatin-like phospholipase family protein, partial [Gammaproteobacteria bacterium]|nr:patatin-like phospholipase family protein [Gammaproteobacteria bacterium]